MLDDFLHDFDLNAEVPVYEDVAEAADLWPWDLRVRRSTLSIPIPSPFLEFFMIDRVLRRNQSVLARCDLRSHPPGAARRGENQRIQAEARGPHCLPVPRLGDGEPQCVWRGS